MAQAGRLPHSPASSTRINARFVIRDPFRPDSVRAEGRDVSQRLERSQGQLAHMIQNTQGQWTFGPTTDV